MLKISDKMRKGSCFATNYYTGGTKSTSVFSGYTSNIGVYKSINSVDEGQFRPGILRINPVEIKRVVGHCTQLQGGSIRNVKTGCGTGQVLEGDVAAINAPGIPSVPSRDNQLYNLAKAKAWSKLNNAELDVGMMLGEGAETLEMLRDILTGRNGLGTFLRNFRKKVQQGSPLGLARLSGKALSDTILEFYLGLVPFMNDIQDTIAFFNDKAKKAALLRRKRGQKVDEDESFMQSSISGFTSMAFATDVTIRIKRKYVATLYYQINPGWTLYEGLNRFGLSPSQMPALAWQLVGRSFLVDWAIGVGTWISGLVPNPSVTVLGGCFSRKYDIERVTHIGNRCQYCPNKGPQLSISQEHVLTAAYLIRTLDASFPPLPAIKYDVVKFHRVLIACALGWKSCDKQLRNLDAALKSAWRKNKVRYTE